MALITIDFPTDAEAELIRRFTVNKNYVQGIGGFLTHRYGRRDELYAGLQSEMKTLPAYQAIQRRPCPIEEVRRYLTLGWASEMQLHLPTLIDQTSMIAFANAWAPVHAYYGTFGLMQAWFAANNMVGLHDDHTATLRSISTMIEKRGLFPQPWNLLAVGCASRGERAYLNDGGEDCAGNVEVLSIPNLLGEDPTFWPRYGTWLRSTRRARLERKEAEWKTKNKKTRIDPKVRDQLARTLHPTSVFDCFWRLRIKSNYGTIDSYLVAHIDDSDHLAFNKGLCTMTRATIALLELLVIRKVGRADFAEIARAFLDQDKSRLSSRLLGKRLTSYGLAP